MSNAVKYLVDEKGNKTSVLVPVKMWNALNDDYKKIQLKLRVFQDIQLSFKEIEEAKKTGRKLPRLKDILR